MEEEKPIKPVHIRYTNRRDETAMRLVLPLKIWYGTTVHYSEPTWIMRAWCFNRNAQRDFQMAKISSWGEGVS